MDTLGSCLFTTSTVKCNNCKRVNHMTRNYRIPIPITTQRPLVTDQKLVVTCFECGARGHFKSKFPSFLSDIIPTAFDVKYAVELADKKIIGADTIIRGCTLNLLNHPFNIDLMPVEHGSFDVIIKMDWLSKYHAMIVCDEKIVHIPFGNEILTIQGDRNDGESNSRLNIISYTKNQKYIHKGCHVFLAQIKEKKEEDKSEKKPFKDVPIVQDFPKVFLEDFPGLPPT
ncbi:putative reverse transcriptase domain-containing protein [Tanacetum coccineum]